MSQQQPTMPGEFRHSAYKGPIKIGDIFPVTGELASKPITTQDASLFQNAETKLLGQTQPCGPAEVTLSAATINEKAGFVSPDDTTNIGYGGVAVTERNSNKYKDKLIVTESIAGQVVEEFYAPPPLEARAESKKEVGDVETIGKALEGVAITAGEKAVERSDAEAIQAAQASATGDAKRFTPGSVGVEARSAAIVNEMVQDKDVDKTKLGDVLRNARLKMPADKEVTAVDAERVMAAELENNPEATIYPGGVAECMAAAARANQRKAE